MKNPHGVEATRYMKRKESDYAISCYSEYGPVFGNGSDEDIYIGRKCNEENNCFIYNNDSFGYECNNEYKISLYVNTAGVDEENRFSVLDYEVFGIDCENRDNINKLCKHPDIMIEYIETKNISEESLKKVYDEQELLTDLDAILCNDSSIRLKISRLCLKNPSKFLPNTQLVNEQYDSKLRKWVGNYQWKMIYRASEYGYSGESFHQYCDNVIGPTLVVIKSSIGWIFGGYTTQSWKVVHPDENGCIFIVI